MTIQMWSVTFREAANPARGERKGHERRYLVAATSAQDAEARIRADERVAALVANAKVYNAVPWAGAHSVYTGRF